MKVWSLVVGGAVCFAGGFATAYFTFSAQTQAFERRAQRAEAVAEMLTTMAEEASATADSAEAVADSLLNLPPQTPTTVVQTIVREAPDTCKVPIGRLVKILAERDTTIARQTRAILALQFANKNRKRATGLALEAVDSVGTALASRPSAQVHWQWRPRLNVVLGARWEAQDGFCALVGPRLGLWRLEVAAYGNLCTVRPDPLVTQVEPRFGVRLVFTF